MDNITIERIWQDNDFFEIRVTAQSQMIWATTDLYVSDMTDLANNLIEFTLNKEEYFWKTSETTAIDRNLSFRVIPKDKLGHILIEVFMLVKDCNLPYQHNCTFFVQTEIGLLNTFGERILSINKPVLGTKISLVDNE